MKKVWKCLLLALLLVVVGQGNCWPSDLLPVTSVQLKKEGDSWSALVTHATTTDTQQSQLAIPLPPGLIGAPEFVRVTSTAKWSHFYVPQGNQTLIVNWRKLADDGTPVRVFVGAEVISGIMAFKDDKLIVVSQSLADGIRYITIDPKKVTAIDDLSLPQVDPKTLMLNRDASSAAVSVVVQYQIPIASPEFSYVLHIPSDSSPSELQRYITCENVTGVDWPWDMKLEVKVGNRTEAVEHPSMSVDFEATALLVSEMVEPHWVWTYSSGGLAKAPYLDLKEPGRLAGLPAGNCLVHFDGLNVDATTVAEFKKEFAFRLGAPAVFGFRTSVGAKHACDGNYALGVVGPWLYQYTIQHAKVTAKAETLHAIPVQFVAIPDRNFDFKLEPDLWGPSGLDAYFVARRTAIGPPSDIRTIDVSSLNEMRLTAASPQDQAAIVAWIELLKTRDSLVEQIQAIAPGLVAIQNRQTVEVNFELTQFDEGLLKQSAMLEQALATILQQMQSSAAQGVVLEGTPPPFEPIDCSRVTF